MPEQPPPGGAPPLGDGADGGEPSEPDTRKSTVTRPGADDISGEPAIPEGDDGHGAYMPGVEPKSGASQPVRLRLSDTLAIVRALRPLKRRVPSSRPDDVVVDEEATAERAAQLGLWWPVTAPESQRWLDLTLVVDASPSMSLWRSTVAGLVSVIEQAGAFRSIQTRMLDTDRPGQEYPEVPILRGGTRRTPARSSAELLDSSGRRILLVVTDGVGEIWQQDLLYPMFAQWGRAMPTGVLQLLPQPHWGRGQLPMHRTRLTVPGPLVPNARWSVELADSWLDPTIAMPEGAVPVPVIELGARWLAWWSRLITGGHRAPANATVLFTGDKPYPTAPYAGAYDDAGAEPAAKERVAAFVGVASPLASRLATLLAAVPVTVRVARLVQAELLPESGTEHLVEVLASDLLQPQQRDGHAWDSATFEFRQGVRHLLLSRGTRSETARVIRLVAGRFGGEDPALSRLQDAVVAPDDTPDPAYTAEQASTVSLERIVMRALSGPYLSRADRLDDAIKQQTQEDRPQSSTRIRLDNTVTEISNDLPPESASSPVSALDDPEATTVSFRPGVRQESAAAGRPGLLLEFGATVSTDRRLDGVPTIWGNVPPRNPNFTGRVELLEQLGKRLTAGGATVVLPAALHGMGGIGKTQMAVEYIYRRLDQYDIVWWIQATQAAQIRAGLTELAQYLNLPGSAEAHTAVPAVREALRLGRPFSRWLLVFDAAESPDVVRPFFPNNGPGEVLITSRNPDWAGIARPLEITVFSRDESVELLRRRGPDIADEDADQLAEKLGDLPLAIEQAAAWRAETGMPVREYLRLFDEKVAEILDTSAPDHYEVSVAAAWNVSFDELSSRNPAAHQLLQVCAFLAPEPISRSLFTGVRGISVSPELDTALRDPMQLSRAVRDINRYGLAKIDHRSDTLLLHRLVQLVLRNRMNPQRSAEMRHGAHLLLANYDPNDPKSAKQWPRYQDIVPHVRASELIDCDDAWVRQLVLNIMQYLYFWGDHAEAANMARQAHGKWSAALGENDLQVLQAATLLGTFLWALGEFSEAAQLNQRTLELRRQASGENSEETVVAQLRVAGDLKAGGEFAAARDLNEEIHQKAKAFYGEDDPVTLLTAHDLAVSVRLCGDYRRALDLDEHTFTRRAEIFGYDSVAALNTLSGVAMDRRELGNYPLARIEHEQIAERVQRVLGEDKADTLRRFAYLSVARRKDGDHAGALELSSRALGLFRQRYGVDHPDAMACALAHSIDVRHSDDLEAARQYGEQTFDRYRSTLGEHHPNTLSAAVDLAVTLRLRGDAEGARQLNERSLEQFRATLGADHPHAIVCAIDLASDLSALGEVEKALALGEEALDRARRALGGKHPTALAAGLNVALDLRALGRTPDSDRQFADVLARYREVLGDTHPATVAATKGLRANCDIDPLPF
jgi:tetratricopeptide (TPR) repeat protein